MLSKSQILENIKRIRDRLDVLEEIVKKENLTNVWQIYTWFCPNIVTDFIPKSKEMTDKYPSLWNCLQHNEKLIIDHQRASHEDWEQVLSIPFQIYKELPPYVLRDILMLAYPDNIWINKPLFVLQEMQSIRNSVNKINLNKMIK